MSYRFVKITTFYPDYLADYYLRNPQTANEPYGEQLKHLLDDAFGWAGHYATHLRELGVDAHEIITNALPLQQAWASERGIKVSAEGIVLEQLKALRPDILFVQDTATFNGDWVTQIRETIPSIRLVFGWCCYPYTNQQLKAFRVFNALFTCTPGFVKEFTIAGIKAYLLNHAFAHTLLPSIMENDQYPDVDFLFSGSLGSNVGYHNIRRQIIEAIVESNFTIHVHTTLDATHPVRLRMKQAAFIAASAIRAVQLDKFLENVPGIRKALNLSEFPRQSQYSDKLLKTIRPPLYGLEMLKALSRAKIGLNIHIDKAGNYAGNIRLFEVTGVGSCLMTDWKENLHELFDIDREIVTYTSHQECTEKVTWLLQNPEERQNIARAGQARTLRDHTYAQRARQLDGIIQSTLRNGS